MSQGYPFALAAQVSWAALTRRPRPFGPDSVRLLATLQPPPTVRGIEEVPAAGGLVLIFNHYYSPTFPSWWSAVVLTALVQSRRLSQKQGIRWIMTEVWTYQDPVRSRLLSPLSRCVFRHLAHVYGFVAMPPMPPRPHEVEARARAVREVLALAPYT